MATAKGESHALNTVKSCWDDYELPTLNTPRYALSAVTINNQVYAVCGSDRDNNLSTIEVLGVRVNRSGWVTWVSKRW